MARWRNVYTSSATLTLWCHFTRRERIYGDFNVAVLQSTRILTELYGTILTKIGFSQQIFTKVRSIKFHGNPCSSSSADTCGRTDMTQLLGAFCDYAKTPTDYCKRNCMWKKPLLTEYKAAPIPAVHWTFKPITSWTQATNATSIVSTFHAHRTPIPLHARTAPEGSRRLRLPDFKTVGTWSW